MDILDKLAELVTELFSKKENLIKKKQAEEEADNLVAIQLSYAVLLADLAMADRAFDAREYSYIYGLFIRDFGLTEDETDLLLSQAFDRLDGMWGTHQFAMFLSEKLSKAEKEKIVQTLDELLVSDGISDGYEQHLKRKLADILETSWA